MNGAPLRKIPNPSTPRSTSEQTSNSTPRPAFNPTLAPPRSHKPERRPNSGRGDRLREIFPPGCVPKSTSKSTGEPYNYNPNQLKEIMEHYRGSGGQHAEQTVVTSAWYGKQTKSAKHEFIVIHVEDPAIPGLKNCIAIDRSQDNPAPSKVATASSSPIARDTFKVSHDGDLPRLLQESHLSPYLVLEEISFQSDRPLLLRELVTLVFHISKEHRRYNPVDTNCYWFTGLIWECMRRMCPSGIHDAIIPGKRGRIGYIRFIPNPFQIRSVLQAVRNGINESHSEPATPNFQVNASEEDMSTTASLAITETNVTERT